jgi:hypothetical protein
MKTTALAEAMICAFSAILEVLPAQYQGRIAWILSSAVAGNLITDADAVRVLDCLVTECDRRGRPENCSS